MRCPILIGLVVIALHACMPYLHVIDKVRHVCLMHEHRDAYEIIVMAGSQTAGSPANVDVAFL